MRTILFILLTLFIPWPGAAQPVPPANGSPAHDPRFYEDLAAYHSPILFQEVENNPRADIPTRFDFDGDWNGDDNWADLYDPALKPSLYYQVFETRTHFFIFYGAFYPRDYWKICISLICHENDFEGAMITVAKDATPFGTKILLVETEHHGQGTTDTAPDFLMPLKDFAGFEPHAHFVLYAEGGKHGVYPWHGGHLGSYTVAYTLGSGTSIGDIPWLLRPSTGYRLEPLAELWNRREEVGNGQTYYNTYDYRGHRFKIDQVPYSFTGKKYGDHAANPPWAWGLFGGLNLGDWFFDPASSVCITHLHCDSSFSKEYVYNPYLGIG